MPRHLLLRLYVNPAWRHGGLHTPLLNPWWGNPNEDVSLFAKEMFDTYHFDPSLYAVPDDLQQADLVLAPYKHQWFMRHDRALWEECVRTAEEAGLPLLVDGVGDVEYPVAARNAYILRIGGYRFLPEKGRIQVPPPSDDLLERGCGGQLRLRAKSAGGAGGGVGGGGLSVYCNARRRRSSICARAGPFPAAPKRRKPACANSGSRWSRPYCKATTRSKCGATPMTRHGSSRYSRSGASRSSWIPSGTSRSATPLTTRPLRSLWTSAISGACRK